jgi:hypothetical protein
MDFLAELTPYCIEARYVDYKESLNEIIIKKRLMNCLGIQRGFTSVYTRR